MRIPKLIKNTGIYGVFGILSSLMPFFLLSILTRYLTQDDYGRLAIFNILIMFLTPVLLLEMQQALKREYVEYKSDFNQYVGSLTLMTLFFLLLLIFLISGLSFFLDSLLGLPFYWVYIALFIAFGKVHWLVLMSLFQIQDKALLVSVWGLISRIILFVPTVLLIVFYDFSWEGRAWSEFIVNVFIQGPLCIFLLTRLYNLKWAICWQCLKAMAAFSLPLVPVAIANYVVMLSDRIFLTNMIGLETVGVYSVAVQISSIMILLSGFFRPSWESWVYRNLKNVSEEGNRKTVMALYGFGAIMAITGLFLVSVLPLILPFIVGEDFIGASDYFVFLILGGMLFGLHVALLPFILYIKKTRLLNYITIFMALLNCALNYIFIRNFGAIGAAQATAVTYFIGYCLTLKMVQQNHQLPWLLGIIKK